MDGGASLLLPSRPGVATAKYGDVLCVRAFDVEGGVQVVFVVRLRALPLLTDNTHPHTASAAQLRLCLCTKSGYCTRWGGCDCH
jgi:hypothetical protein